MKRALLIIVITLVGVISAFVDAFWGLLLHTWYSFGAPLEISFGKFADSRLSFMIGGLLLLLTAQQYRRILILGGTSFFAMLYLLACFASLASRLEFNLVSVISQMETLIKLVVVALLTPVLLDSRKKISLLIVVVVLSASGLGAYYGFFGLLAGSRAIAGPGKFGDNNGYATFLTSLLPFVVLCARYAKSILHRLGFVAILAGNIFALILTFSRGGFLASATVLTLLAFQIRLWLGAVVLFFGGLALTATLSSTDGGLGIKFGNSAQPSVIEETMSEYQERLRSLKNYQEEDLGSAASRFHFWQIALDMFLEHPVLGVGFGRYSDEYDNFDTSNGKFGRGRSVHNTFLAVLSETGMIGSACFVMIFGFAALSFIRAYRVLSITPLRDTDGGARSTIVCAFISATGFVVGGSFLNCIHHESIWLFVSLSIALERYALGFVESVPAKDAVEGQVLLPQEAA